MADTIIIIRGNSGSGKTTVAKELCKKLGSDCMLLSQDVIRRDILHTKDGENNTAIDLLKMLIMYGKTQSKIIILEGILKFQWYSSIFDVIKKNFSNIYSYYYDLPFEETVKRFETKSDTSYTKEDMKRWWNEKDYLNFNNEKTISINMSVDNVVEMILNDIQWIVQNVFTNSVLKLIDNHIGQCYTSYVRSGSDCSVKNESRTGADWDSCILFGFLFT